MVSMETELCLGVEIMSDYGSEIDDQDLSELLSTANSQPLDSVILTSIEQDPITEHAIVHVRSSGQSLHESGNRVSEIGLPVVIATNIEYNRTPEQRSVSRGGSRTKAESSPPVDDSRSPLERFRTHPKKPLSVTDIVSPAWCEQQYLFSLSKHGRVRRTPAMKQGSAVHKVLEEQVYTTVRIEVKSREDMFGLKLWNVVQGLRALQQTGLTRELEVWGLLHGQVINGVIDVVTSSCPDTAYEEKLPQQQGVRQAQKRGSKLEANQTTLADFVTTESGSRSQEATIESTYYLMDVKTRQSRTVPADDGRLRPIQMQLMLYHHLLSTLSTDGVNRSAIFDRYNLDGDTVFSDIFIAEVAKLDLDAYDSKQDSVAGLLEHNTLHSLWQYMIQEFSKTLASSKTALSNMLTAEFRSGVDGALLGKRSFDFEPATLDAYVQDELSWWKGERSTKGVEIEEAFKCRICEFAEDCSWRKNKVEEAVQQTRQRKAALVAQSGNG